MYFITFFPIRLLSGASNLVFLSPSFTVEFFYCFLRLLTFLFRAATGSSYFCHCSSRPSSKFSATIKTITFLLRCPLSLPISLSPSHFFLDDGLTSGQTWISGLFSNPRIRCVRHRCRRLSKALLQEPLPARHVPFPLSFVSLLFSALSLKVELFGHGTDARDFWAPFARNYDNLGRLWSRLILHIALAAFRPRLERHRRARFPSLFSLFYPRSQSISSIYGAVTMEIGVVRLHRERLQLHLPNRASLRRSDGPRLLPLTPSPCNCRLIHDYYQYIYYFSLFFIIELLMVSVSPCGRT